MGMVCLMIAVDESHSHDANDKRQPPLIDHCKRRPT